MASRRMNEKPEVMAPRRDAMCLKFLHKRIIKDGHENPTETKKLEIVFPSRPRQLQ